MRKLLVVAALALLASASTAGADNPALTAGVGAGDSFQISLAGPDGAAARNLAPGTYTLLVHDKSALHNFHLFGPGNVDVSTTVGGVGDQTFTVTLVPGRYLYVCDEHPTSMKGSFTVGAEPAATTTASTPKPKPKHHAKPKKKHHKKR
jgi:plastocyanin